MLAVHYDAPCDFFALTIIIIKVKYYDSPRDFCAIIIIKVKYFLLMYFIEMYIVCALGNTY